MQITDVTDVNIAVLCRYQDYNDMLEPIQICFMDYGMLYPIISAYHEALCLLSGLLLIDSD